MLFLAQKKAQKSLSWPIVIYYLSLLGKLHGGQVMKIFTGNNSYDYGDVRRGRNDSPIALVSEDIPRPSIFLTRRGNGCNIWETMINYIKEVITLIILSLF